MGTIKTSTRKDQGGVSAGLIFGEVYAGSKILEGFIQFLPGQGADGTTNQISLVSMKIDFAGAGELDPSFDRPIQSFGVRTLLFCYSHKNRVQTVHVFGAAMGKTANKIRVVS